MSRELFHISEVTITPATERKAIVHTKLPSDAKFITGVAYVVQGAGADPGTRLGDLSVSFCNGHIPVVQDLDVVLASPRHISLAKNIIPLGDKVQANESIVVVYKDDDIYTATPYTVLVVFKYST